MQRFSVVIQVTGHETSFLVIYEREDMTAVFCVLILKINFRISNAVFIIVLHVKCIQEYPYPCTTTTTTTTTLFSKKRKTTAKQSICPVLAKFNFGNSKMG